MQLTILAQSTANGNGAPSALPPPAWPGRAVAPESASRTGPKVIKLAGSIQCLTGHKARADGFTTCHQAKEGMRRIQEARKRLCDAYHSAELILEGHGIHPSETHMRDLEGIRRPYLKHYVGRA